MKTLIVYAHPDTPGHCPVILEQLESELKERGMEYEVLDLYGMGYDPILHEKEHYTSGNKIVSEENKRIQEKIKASKFLIFIYPIWWNMMPAILKGFIDRVFTPGFAFSYSPFGTPKKLLKGRKAIVYMTLGSPHKILTRLIFGNEAVSLIKDDILGFSGVKTDVHQLFNARGYEEGKREKIKGFVAKGLKKLD